jgi:hypothetical protein
MTATTRTIEPTQITKGERVAWTKSYDDYSAAEYSLEYRFRGITGGAGFNVTATADGADFDAAITAVQSATMTAGTYEWQPWLTQIGTATNTFVAPGGGGRLTVKDGFPTGTTTAVDTRSTAKKIMDAIDTALLTSATDADVIEYEISTGAGTRKVKRSREDAMKTRSYYATIYANEQARERMKNGGSFGTTYGVRFFDE